MKKSIIGLLILTPLVFGPAAARAASSESISVTATITAAALDVSVTPAGWAVGSIAEGSTPDTVAAGPDYFTATNNRNAPENLTLTVASSGNWTAANAPGADQFAMNFSTTGAAPTWTLIDAATGSALATGLGAGGSVTFDLQLLAPTSTTAAGTEQTILTTVTAS